MRIEQILAKDIGRDLDGVVKASNFAQLRTEVDEYVITAEVARHLGDLLDVYTRPGDPQSNGVWISGFYGSGKSHLLKMLAHLLGDVDGAAVTRAEVVAAFVDKIPADDALLRGALERSGTIPARSLLFNIDEKVDKHDKDQADALLKVFVQVFYDSCGFFGATPYIARFERDLDEKGLFGRFREAFARDYGKPWEEGRKLAVLVEPTVARVYTEITGEVVDKPLTAYRDSYTMSIEGFADEVAAWLAAQPGPDTRLNFFVDEVGQFIGQDGRLMLSLQTIAESLFIRCNGRSWVTVTSQEDMDSIIGDRSRRQQYDFSKIQARFRLPLKLDSKNVREVVSKRLLEKTDDGAAELAAVYQQNKDRFRSLFALPDRSRQNYATEDDFVGTYPLVDYQFELFHDALRGLSDYNAFTGRHTSAGERSLLGVTSEIGTMIRSQPVGTLATFDMFYDGIEKAVLSDVKRNITVAEQNLTGADAGLAVRVLKVLLMVKYIDQFEATPAALTVLLTPRIDTNVAELTAEVERALQMLVRNTYAQRTGSTYNYLTDEEQDVEKAIKATARDESAIKKLLNEEIVKASGVGGKVRHDETGFDLGLERLLDGQRQGRSEQVAVHFITPLGGYELDQVKFQSVGSAGALFVVLDLSRSEIEEIDLLVRTREYTQLQMTSQLSESRRRILDAQQRNNAERQRTVMKAIQSAVAGALLLHNGSELTGLGGAAKDRVHAGLQVAIEAKYTRIGEARAVAGMRETDIAGVLRADEDVIPGVEAESTLDGLVAAVVAAVRQGAARQVISYVGSLAETFGEPPYGWSLTAVQLAVAHGVATDRLRLLLDRRPLTRSEIPGEVRNTAKLHKLVVEEVRAHDPAAVRRLRDFLNEYRDITDAPAGGEDLIARVREVLAEDLAQVTGWAQLPYPFGPEVARADAALRAATIGREPDWYLGPFLETAEELLDLKTDFLDPVRAFLSSAQQGIVDDAARFLADYGAEFGPGDTDRVQRLRAALASPTFFRGNGVPQIKTAHRELRARLQAAVDADREELRGQMESALDELLDDEVYQRASGAAQQQAQARLRAMMDLVETRSSRADLALTHNRFDAEYQQVVEALIAAAAPTPAPPGATPPAPDPDAGSGGLTGTGDGEEGAGPAQPGETPTPVETAPAPAVPRTVNLRELALAGAPRTISSAQQADQYIEALRAALAAAIEDGKTIIR